MKPPRLHHTMTILSNKKDKMFSASLCEANKSELLFKHGFVLPLTVEKLLLVGVIHTSAIQQTMISFMNSAVVTPK